MTTKCLISGNSPIPQPETRYTNGIPYIDFPVRFWYIRGVRVSRFTKAAGAEWAGTWAEESFTDNRGGRWLAAARLAVRDGQIVITELRVIPDERNLWRLHRQKDVRFGGISTARPHEWGHEKPGEWSGNPEKAPKDGLHATAMKNVRLGNFIPTVQTWIASTMAFAGAKGYRDSGAFYVDMALPGAAQLTPRPRPRRNVGRDDFFYAWLADEYVRAAATSRSPVKDIAKRRNEEPDHIRDLLHEARVRGLLSKGKAGTRGGYLTARASALLSEHTEAMPRKSTKTGRRSR